MDDRTVDSAGSELEVDLPWHTPARIAGQVCGVLSVGFLIAALLTTHIEVGSKAEWLSGVGTLTAVVVALWQTINIQKQAKEQARDAQERLERELKAAEARSARELMHARAWEFKLVLIQLFKVIKAYRLYLSRVAEQGIRSYTFDDKTDRQDAMLRVHQDLTAQEVSSEIVDALLLTHDETIRESLRQIQPLITQSLNADIRFRFSIRQGHDPDPMEIIDSISDIQEAIDRTRQVAAERLDTGRK